MGISGGRSTFRTLSVCPTRQPPSSSHSMVCGHHTFSQYWMQCHHQLTWRWYICWHILLLCLDDTGYTTGWLSVNIQGNTWITRGCTLTWGIRIIAKRFILCMTVSETQTWENPCYNAGTVFSWTHCTCQHDKWHFPVHIHEEKRLSPY